MEGDATPVKLILLGDSAVGKSKLVDELTIFSCFVRFSQGGFSVIIE